MEAHQRGARVGADANHLRCSGAVKGDSKGGTGERSLRHGALRVFRGMPAPSHIMRANIEARRTHEANPVRQQHLPLGLRVIPILLLQPAAERQERAQHPPSAFGRRRSAATRHPTGARPH